MELPLAGTQRQRRLAFASRAGLSGALIELFARSSMTTLVQQHAATFHQPVMEGLHPISLSVHVESNLSEAPQRIYAELLP